MDTSYAELAQRLTVNQRPGEVNDAIRLLQCHNSRSVICSQCENNDRKCFKVTAIDNSGYITEVKCKRCKKTSYVCRYQECCLRRLSASCLGTSYKENVRSVAFQRLSRSTPMCVILECTVTALERHGDGDHLRSCTNREPHQLRVTGVDRLGFITSVQCPTCQTDVHFSPLEASYIAQLQLPPRHQDRGNYPALSYYIHELCRLLRRHSFYSNSICAEYEDNDQENCRVTAIDNDGQVTEVEFVTPGYNQSLRITCRSNCYYTKYPLPSEYEMSYKEKVRTQHREQANGTRSEKAILSCTVLTATAAILRRHNDDFTLCQNCNNDDHQYLQVHKIDEHGFISDVKCIRPDCRQSVSTACHHSRFYYEQIHESTKLKRGDHIGWHRNLPYWHHAVVTGANEQTVTLAEYVRHGCSLTLEESTISSRDISPSCGSGIPYRITYEDCYTKDYTGLRAEKSVGRKEYHLLNRNCEHISHWCKTGISRSDQLKTCYSSVGKTLLAWGLRIVNMLLLVAFQVIHEEREGIQIDRKAFERFEHILVGVYMSFVFLLFLFWSLYSECKKLKPADANKCCFGRPSGVACGLTIRIITRELNAAAWPFVVIWFEDRILPQEDTWIKCVTVSVVLFGVYVGSYVSGAVIGTLLEFIYISRCRSCCGDATQDGRPAHELVQINRPRVAAGRHSYVPME